jgi:uncharacterized protein (TIGR03382 family)
MRKLISFLALTVFATSVCAQGVVTFANNVITPNTPYVLDPYGARLTGTQWAAQLYYGASQTSLAAHTAAPNRFRTAGSSLAGTWSTATGANRTLNGGGVGVPVFMQIRVWNLDLFPTYEAAAAGGGIYGRSLPIFQYVQRLSTPTPSVTDTYMTDPFGNPLFSNMVWVVPEPGVGLLAIPALALLAWQFRRRRFIPPQN